MWSNYKQNLGDFNPRTPCGVRLHRTVSTQAQSNFNPRTPCGVRRIGITKKLTTKGISIHAPLAGCDGSNGVWWPIFNYFNPRTPCGVRQAMVLNLHSGKLFQSTHPLRGATVRYRNGEVESLFQSTHPLRGATLFQCGLASGVLISIHAPLAGCDDRAGGAAGHHEISIHAPLAGCDPDGTSIDFITTEFQSTHPLRGATVPPSVSLLACFRISIHAPLAGCDRSSPLAAHSLTAFQSTHPLRGATSSRFVGYLKLRFQSTHPLRGATAKIHKKSSAFLQ